MPPSWASAIARRASVTVSIAAETSGRLRRMFREREVERSVSRGRTLENAGTSNTSSKVSALPRRRIRKSPDAKANYTDAVGKFRFERAGAGLQAEARPVHSAPVATTAPCLMVRDSVFRTAMTAAAAVLVLVSLPAEAQWKWKDKGGRIQYSDLPPPAGTPDQDILARPTAPRRAGAAAPAAASAASASHPAAVAAAGTSAPKGVDPELEAKRKKAEGEVAAKNKAEEDRIAAAKADNCARAQTQLRTFESGIRVDPHQRQGRARVPRRQAARRRDQARQGRRSPPTARSSGGLRFLFPALRRDAAAPPSDPSAAAGRSRPGRPRRAAHRAPRSGPRCPRPGSRCRPHRRPSSRRWRGSRRARSRPPGSSMPISQASPGRADQATATCSIGAPLARAIDLLGAADEGVDEGVGDPVEHRADGGVEQRRWRRRSACRTRSCRRWPCPDGRRRRAPAAARSARGRRAARTGRRPASPAPTRPARATLRVVKAWRRPE